METADQAARAGVPESKFCESSQRLLCKFIFESSPLNSQQPDLSRQRAYHDESYDSAMLTLLALCKA